MKGLRGLERRWSNLELRAFYSVAELARVGNVPAYRLLRLLRRCGITFLRSGRAHCVALVEIPMITACSSPLRVGALENDRWPPRRVRAGEVQRASW